MVSPLLDETVEMRRELPRLLALVRKHGIQMLRRRQEAICNIGIPVLLAVGLAFLMKQSAGDMPFEESEVFLERTYAPVNILAPWLKSMDGDSTLWFVNSSSRASALVERLLRPASHTIVMPCRACARAPFLCEPACPLIKFARDEEELQRALESDPEQFWAGVVIEAALTTPRHAKLTIRMPDATMTDSRLLRETKTDVKRRPRIAITAQGESEYITSGFASLQYAMQVGIGNALLVDSTNQSSMGAPFTASVKVSKMPHAGFVRKANKIIFGQFLVLMFVPMSVNLARSVSDEKTNGVRALLALTGVRGRTRGVRMFRLVRLANAPGANRILGTLGDSALAWTALARLLDMRWLWPPRTGHTPQPRSDIRCHISVPSGRCATLRPRNRRSLALVHPCGLVCGGHFTAFDWVR